MIKTILWIGIITLCQSSITWADSLFDESAYRPLTADRKAFRSGDNITVLIMENATASANANTDTSRDSGVSANFGALSDLSLAASADALSRTKNRNVSQRQTASIGVSDDFKGGGTVARSGRLLAQLTVNVVMVHPNGDLQIKGEQIIELNNEKQKIALVGRVRPEDIAPDNSVLSTRVSNANISYIGKGVLGEKQQPSLLTRLLSWLSII